jgi:hypothetical protein
MGCVSQRLGVQVFIAALAGFARGCLSVTTMPRKQSLAKAAKAAKKNGRHYSTALLYNDASAFTLRVAVEVRDTVVYQAAQPLQKLHSRTAEVIAGCFRPAPLQ